MNRNKKKIVVYLNSPSMCGGAQQIMVDVINTLMDEFDFEIVTTNDHDDSDFNSKYSCDVSCPLTSFKLKRSSKYPEALNYLWKVPLCTIKYALYLRKRKPDISLSLIEMENIVNIFCAILGINEKTVISLRVNPASPSYPIYLRIFYNVLMYLSRYFADLIIINSSDVKRLLVNKYNIDETKIALIYNPKDIVSIQTRASESVSETFFSTSDPIIITVGRLSNQKGHWHLIRVFAQIVKITSAKLVICGDGPLRDYLTNLAIDLGVEKSVLFLGWCENPYKYINKSTVFVLSSLYEGLPNSLIEAIICGCPSISSDCKTGPSEVLEAGKYGLLTQNLDGIKYKASDPLSESEIDLYNNILRLLNDKKLQENLKTLSYERAMYYDKKIRIQEYAHEFNKILNE